MSTERSSAVSGGQRALAWLAIGCGLLLTVILVVFTVRNLPALAGGGRRVRPWLAPVGGG